MAELDWFPLSEMPRYRGGLGAQFAPYYGGAQFQDYTPALHPVFPDRLFPKTSLHPARQFAEFFTPRFTFVPTAPSLSWKPIAPDLLARPRAVAWSTSTDVLRVNLPAAPTIARAIYPDLLPRSVWRRPFEPTPSLFPTTVVSFGWKVTFPDQIARRRVPVAAIPAVVDGTQQTTNARIQEWTAQYPAQHWTKRLPTETWTKLDPFARPNAAAPTWSWWGYQPERLYPKAGLHASEQQAWTSDRIRPIQPDFSWQAIAPDVLWRRTLTTAARPTFTFQQPIIAPDIRMDWQAGFSLPVRVPRRWMTPLSFLPEPGVSPVVWYPRYIDSFERLYRPMPEMQDLGWGGPILNPNVMAWRSDTSLLPRPRPVFQPPVILLDPVLPTLDHLCIHLREDVVAISTLRHDHATTPTIAEEFTVRPTIREEEVC